MHFRYIQMTVLLYLCCYTEANCGHSCSNQAVKIVTRAALPHSIGVESYRMCLISLATTLNNSFHNNFTVNLSDETKFFGTGLAVAMSRAKQLLESECHVAAFANCENVITTIRQKEKEIEVQIGANDRSLVAVETAVRSATDMYETAQRALRNADRARKMRFVLLFPQLAAAGANAVRLVSTGIAEKREFLANLRENCNSASRRLETVRKERVLLQQQRRQIQQRLEQAHLDNLAASVQLNNLRNQQTKIADLTEPLSNRVNYLTKMVFRTTTLKKNIVEEYVFDLGTVATPIREIADLFATEMKIPSNPWISRLSDLQIRSIREQLVNIKSAQERQQNQNLQFSE